MRRLLAITNKRNELYEAIKDCLNCVIVEYISHVTVDNVEQIIHEINNNCGFVYDSIIIYETNNVLLEKCMFYLYNLNITNIYVVKEYYIEKNLILSENGYFSNKACCYISDWNKPYIAHIETHINDYCNLNCDACNNYAPFFRKGCVASLNVFVNDLKKLSRMFVIGRLYLLGGEPLLEPELTIQFIKKARQILPNVEIRLLTNGLLIPQMTDAFWKCVRENNIILRVSRYVPTSQIIDKINNRLKEVKVKNVVSDEITYFVKKQTTKKMEDMKKSNRICGSSGCHYFRDGYIAKCPDAILVKKFDKCFETNICQNDGIEIDTIEKSEDVVKKLLAPCEMCATCGMERAEHVKWRSGDRRLQKEKWLIDDKLTYTEKLVRKLKRKLITQNLLNRMIGNKYLEFSIVCFGGGDCFHRKRKHLENYICIQYICDNYSESNYIEDIEVIDVKGIQELENPFIIITLENSTYIKQVEKQLCDIGLYNYILVNDFLEKCMKFTS